VAANKVTYSDPLVMCLRVVYYLVQLATLAIAYLIQQKVEAAKDTKKIFLPPAPANPFMPAAPEEANKPKETTYYEHELEQVKMLFKQTVIGVGMVSFIHWKLGMKPVLLLQSIMGPMNLMDNPLFKKYILKSTDRVWGEALEGEEGAGVAAPAIKDEGKKGKKKEKGAPKGVNQVEDAILKVWNKQMPPEKLVGFLTSETVDYQTEEDGWTALMVLSGIETIRKDLITKVIALGADRTLQDGEGQTALHWAALKNSVNAVDVLTDGEVEEVAELFGIKDGSGKTALELAEDNKDSCAEVVDLLKAVKKTSTLPDVD
jgi:hypothetical protein